MPRQVTFRRLTDDDLGRLHEWLNDPDVVAWWEGDDVTWDAVVADYGSEGDPVYEHWVPIVGARPVGWIQCYAAVDAPEECGPWFDLGVERTAAGIDYLVAPEAGRGEGLGSAMIVAFVDDIVFGRHPEWTQVAAGPFEANVPSWRALEKAGFRFVGTIDDADGPCRLMAKDRPDVPDGVAG
ncbi:MAG TPA: GNAT family N-acetyltransferase [Acidimicrobiales bacterium]|nr:GNAT family N-acetyltransferase [Acidimicrobiales bacterium]